MNKNLLEVAYILVITAILSAIANVVGYKGDFIMGTGGALVLAGVTFVGCVLGSLPVLNKLPTVFWVSAFAVLVSIPGVPGQEWIVGQCTKITLLSTTCPILAYAGMSLGKDIGLFKNLSWKIIPVGMCVVAGTFLCAAALAEVMLHLSGQF